MQTFHAVHTADRITDFDEVITAHGLAKLLEAQLKQAQKMHSAAGQRTLILDLYSGRHVRNEQRLHDLLREEAEVFMGWAEDFDYTRHMMELLGLDDSAIDEYQRIVREAAEAVLGG